MATTTTAGAAAIPRPQSPSSPAEDARNGSQEDPAAERDADAPARSDSATDEDDEALDIDQDDAQSIILPALSPAASRLISPRTPAAEKAAAMESLSGGGLFSVVEGSSLTQEPERLAPAAPKPTPAGVGVPSPG